MNYLRKKDDDCYRLCSMQSRIFDTSAKDNIPSYFFIQAFMNSDDAKSLDDLSFLLSGSSEQEIYLNVKKNVKRKKGIVYPEIIMHWIGFIYRCCSYMTGISSKELFNIISPKYLNKVYPAYHGLEAAKVVDIIFKDLEYKKKTPMETFKLLYNSNKILL